MVWVHPTTPSFPSQVCHHADCQQLHRRGPLSLCEACDSKFHSAMHYDGHVRFDLPPQGEHREGAQPPELPAWGRSVLLTVGITTGPSEGHELTVNDETQVHCHPFCSTSFLTREKVGDRPSSKAGLSPPGAGSFSMGLHLPQLPPPLCLPGPARRRSPSLLSSGQGISGQILQPGSQ